MDSVDNILDKYKRQPFSDGLLPYLPTLTSLKDASPKIYAKNDGRQRWVICDKHTDAPALFSHAAVISQVDPEETGNFVLGGEEVPAGCMSKSVYVPRELIMVTWNALTSTCFSQNNPNNKCFYTYVFDTFSDISLFEGQWDLDTYIATVKGFNPTDLPRRPFLSGQEARYRSKFWMQTPVFVRRGSQDGRNVSTAHLHPWILQGEKDSRYYRANPDRPRVWAQAGGKTVPIKDRAPGILQRGDIVAFSFTVTYHITSTNWFPQFHPADIVLLRQSEGDATDYSSPSLDLHSRPPPSFTALQDEERHQEGGGESDSPHSVGKELTPEDDSSAMEDVCDDVPNVLPSNVDGFVNVEAMEVDDEDETRSQRSHTADGDGEYDFKTIVAESRERSLGEDANFTSEDSGIDDFVDVEAEETKHRTRASTTKTKGKRSRGN